MAALGTAIQLLSYPPIVPVSVPTFTYISPNTYSFGIAILLANQGLGGSTEGCFASAPVSPVKVWDGTAWVPTPALVFDGTNWVPA